MRHILILTVLAVPLTLASAHAGSGTNKTFIKNGTSQTIHVWVDNGGRGLSKSIDTQDGRGAHAVGSNEVAVADETNLGDFPTIRVYNAAGKCIYAKEIRYIPLVGDTNHQKWNGSELVGE